MAVRPSAAAGLVVSGLIALATSLGGCQDSGMLGGVSTRSLTPVPAQTVALMQSKGMSQGDPILIRAFKKEAEMEIWKRGGDGRYALLKTFPICRWSGQLGPKTKQGDRQAPEGFYTITPGQMNPNSSYYLSFDVGYPNAVDRAKGSSGNYIMVHGTCSSAGCFAMTDASMSELYAIAREAFAGGQRAFQFQSYPFRMTAANVARTRNDPNAPFWKNLKEGSDYFEALREEPRVGLCGTRYSFGGMDAAAGSCVPRVDPLVAQKRDQDAREVADLVAKGTPALRVVYEDGGQNPVFRPQPPQTALAALTEADKEKDKELAYAAREYARHHLGDVSRPETLASGPQEIEIDAKGRPVLVASADAPGPTRAAAAALSRRPGIKDTAKPVTVVAKAEPEPTKPARITVADADGDPAAYKKLLGTLFSNAETRTPSTPTADAATVPATSPETTAAVVKDAHAKTAARHAPHAGDAAKESVKDPAKAPVRDGAAKASPTPAKPMPSKLMSAKPTTTASAAPRD